MRSVEKILNLECIYLLNYIYTVSNIRNVTPTVSNKVLSLGFNNLLPRRFDEMNIFSPSKTLVNSPLYNKYNFVYHNKILYMHQKQFVVSYCIIYIYN